VDDFEISGVNGVSVACGMRFDQARWYVLWIASDLNANDIGDLPG
jgi:hypothetical protein